MTGRSDEPAFWDPAEGATLAEAMSRHTAAADIARMYGERESARLKMPFMVSSSQQGDPLPLPGIFTWPSGSVDIFAAAGAAVQRTVRCTALGSCRLRA